MRVLIASSILCSSFFVNSAFALQQKMLFNVESISYGSEAAPYCPGICREEYTDPPLKKVLDDGWRIINSSPKEALGSNTGDARYKCMCIGTQYVLQKDDPIELKPEMPNKTDELLKKENELLKKENDLLKQENKHIKALLKLKQKKR